MSFVFVNEYTNTINFKRIYFSIVARRYRGQVNCNLLDFITPFYKLIFININIPYIKKKLQIMPKLIQIKLKVRLFPKKIFF